MTKPLSREEATEFVQSALRGFATDDELSALPPDENLRDALELDSMDFQTFVERLSTGLDRRIDEDDYGRLLTLRSAADFLTAQG
ncbi:phosphopantetheine-binding protein [Amycolatopsis sp. NPDC059027]|uniref:phosphopantetheine-binding protein n=1 Tax=unclassified Amycolatopsis TaxID=2618356 RepID=UPI00366EAC32